MRNIAFILAGFIFALTLATEQAEAQWGIGASYEIRNEDPNNGFGFRVEKEILSGLPLLDLNMRGHFSFFNETNRVTLQDGIRASQDLDVYDFGLAAVAGFNIGMVKPFAGLGIGRERFELSADHQNLQSFKESNFYWNAFGGAEVSLLPFLKPFIEYRISRLTSTDDLDVDNVGRLAVGVNLRF